MLDTAIHRTLFVELSSSEQLTFLEGIQKRRLETVERYKALVAQKKEAKDAKIEAQRVRVTNSLQKRIDRLNDLFEDIDSDVAKLTALHAMIEGGA